MNFASCFCIHNLTWSDDHIMLQYNGQACSLIKPVNWNEAWCDHQIMLHRTATQHDITITSCFQFDWHVWWENKIKMINLATLQRTSKPIVCKLQSTKGSIFPSGQILLPSQCHVPSPLPRSMKTRGLCSQSTSFTLLIWSGQWNLLWKNFILLTMWLDLDCSTL